MVLSSNDIVPSLQTGLINAVSEPPIFVSLRLGRSRRPSTCSTSISGCSTGATVVRKETWDKIAPDVQQKLMAISNDTAKMLSAEIKHLDDDAVTQMKQQGLEVTESPDAAWQAVVEKRLAERPGGKVVPADLFDEVKRLVKEYWGQPSLPIGIGAAQQGLPIRSEVDAENRLGGRRNPATQLTCHDSALYLVT